VAVSFTVRSLTFRYPGQESAALDCVTLDNLPDRGTIALLGPSGSGKTTLLNVLGLLWEGPRAAGEVVYRGREGALDYAGLSPTRRAELRLSEFGFVLQTCYLLPHFSCLQNIALPLALQGWGKEERLARVKRLLERADDKELIAAQARHGGEVSLGQRQRIAVLRAIVHDPCVIFADEPTSNLDRKNTERMLEILNEWRENRLGVEDGPPRLGAQPRTLVLVCHQLETALRHAQWLVVLNDEHRVEASFAVEEWPSWAATVNAALDAHVPPDFLPRPSP
jgi:ABC-type lipoprotein export system ATPase subunit